MVLWVIYSYYMPAIDYRLIYGCNTLVILNELKPTLFILKHVGNTAMFNPFVQQQNIDSVKCKISRTNHDSI